MFKKPADGVVFAEDKIEKEFISLKEDHWLKKSIRKAIKNLKENIFFGEHIKKKLIPEEYTKKYEINNLWRCQLPNAWRLVYTIMTPNKSETLAVILEWFDHKNYEKRFGYK